MTYLEGADYFVRLVDLPYSVKALVSENDDGTYSMYLNARYGDEQRINSYFHEMEHIERDDFNNGESIYIVEGIKPRPRV